MTLHRSGEPATSLAGRVDGAETPVASDTGPTPTVAEVGEFGLISRLARIVQASDADPLRPAAAGEIAIGDDAALWRPADGAWEVLTTDALIEDVHFRRRTTSWFDLGWKSLAVNVSDVAAMGGRPRRAFVTIGVPGTTAVADLEALYRGLRELADQYDLAVVGGDTVLSPIVVISVTVVGEVHGPALRRVGGRPGDLVAVTGTLGGSRGGLELLEADVPDPQDADAAALIERHRRPRPRVQEGLALAAAGVGCGMDVSDGLLGDLAKLAYASGVGARLFWEAVPVDPTLEHHAGTRARGLALAGGEDYELVVAAPPESIDRARSALERAGLAPLTIVGELTNEPAGTVMVLDRAGRRVKLAEGSWDHFAAPPGER